MSLRARLENVTRAMRGILEMDYDNDFDGTDAAHNGNMRRPHFLGLDNMRAVDNLENDNSFDRNNSQVINILNVLNTMDVLETSLDEEYYFRRMDVLDKLRNIIDYIEQFGVSDLFSRNGLNVHGLNLLRDIVNIRVSIIPREKNFFLYDMNVISKYMIWKGLFSLSPLYVHNEVFVKSNEDFGIINNNSIKKCLSNIASFEFNNINRNFREVGDAPVQKSFFREALENRNLELVEDKLLDALKDISVADCKLVDKYIHYFRKYFWVESGFEYLEKIVKRESKNIENVLCSLTDQVQKIQDIKNKRSRSMTDITNEIGAINCELSELQNNFNETNNIERFLFQKGIADFQISKLEKYQTNILLQVKRLTFREDVLRIHQDIWNKKALENKNKLSYIKNTTKKCYSHDNWVNAVVNLIWLGKDNKISNTKTIQPNYNFDNETTRFTKSRELEMERLFGTFERSLGISSSSWGRIITYDSLPVLLNDALIKAKEEDIEILKDSLEYKNLNLGPLFMASENPEVIGVIIQNLIREGCYLNREILENPPIKSIICSELNCLATDIRSLNTKLPYVGLRVAMELGGLQKVDEYINTCVRSSLEQRYFNTEDVDNNLKILREKSIEFLVDTENKMLNTLIKNNLKILKSKNSFTKFYKELLEYKKRSSYEHNKYFGSGIYYNKIREIRELNDADKILKELNKMSIDLIQEISERSGMFFLYTNNSELLNELKKRYLDTIGVISNNSLDDVALTQDIASTSTGTRKRGRQGEENYDLERVSLKNKSRKGKEKEY